MVDSDAKMTMHPAKKTKTPNSSVLMKKNNLRNLALVALILFSLASFIYLNTTIDVPEVPSPEQSVQVEEEDKENNDMMLPDVRAIKTILEKGRRMLPAS